MKQRLRLWLLAVALVGAAAPPAPAQTVRLSHVPIQGGISPDVADAYLQRRFRDAQTTADFERLIDDLGKNPRKLGIDKPEDQEALKRALEKAGGQPERLLADADVRRIIGEAAQKSGTMPDLTREEQRRLEELARRFLPPSDLERLDSTKPNDTGAKPAGAAAAGPGAPGQPPDSASPPAPTPTPDPAPTPSAPPPPPANAAMTEHLRDIAGALADSPLAESPAFRRMVASFDRVKPPEAPGFVAWDRRLEQWQQRFAAVGSHVPKVSWPKVDFAPHRPGGREPAGPALPAEPAGGGSEVVFVLLAAAGAGLLALGLLRRRGLLLLGGAGGGWRLGPWPVRPEAVGTRDELVRAFEYLALLRLGPTARHRNHRDIAAGLGAEDEVRRTAAERLAGLYEQARYAPPDEALPDADLAEARTSLSLLAGVAAA